MAVVFLMFTQYRERPILLRRRIDLNTEGNKMNESMAGCISTGEDAGGCQRVSLSRDIQTSVLSACVSPLQAKTNITLHSSFWAWLGG